MTGGNEDNKKSFIHKFLSMRMNNGDESKVMKNSYDPTEAQVGSAICLLDSMAMSHDVQSLRVFAATWNVAGKTPSSDLDLDNFLQVHCQSDIYILGFQEIVPLNAGNVLAIEDNGSAAKWLSLISQSLNKSANNSYSPLKRTNTNSYAFERKCSGSGSLFMQRTSLKTASRAFRSESRRILKSCNCTVVEPERKSYGRDSCFACQKSKSKSNGYEYASSSEEEDNLNNNGVAAASPHKNQHLRYSLIKSKQMVGIFVTIWVKKELVPYIGHLRTSCISRGILGCLGNKGCIAVSMTIKQTSFCFVASHLASGEKEGDQLRRNLDVIEILKSTQFPKICRSHNTKVPDKILDHDRIIWLGDLNYRIALSYHETKKHLELNDWDALLNKDQLKIEREAGRDGKKGRYFLHQHINTHTTRICMLETPYNQRAKGEHPHEAQVGSAICLLDSMAMSHDVQSLSFQEIVPLNAGNVLAIEDNGSAAKWLSLISQSLNKLPNNNYIPLNRTNTNSYAFERKCSGSGSLFMQRTFLKAASRAFRSESRRILKSCNCAVVEPERKSYGRDSCFACQKSKSKSNGYEYASSSEEDDNLNNNGVAAAFPHKNQHLRYSLIKSKQMVGIFVTIWVKKELVPYIGHLRTSCISRGILGCLGNKGCIAVSMTIKQTSFCFVASHLASGEKEGDQLRRNLDVIEILKSTQFPKICRSHNTKVPDKILDHDRIIWLGDLNYRIALSYHETKKHLELNDWDALLNKDQLKIEREAGRVFAGWKEGKIFFAPTYKYSYNSDLYAGDTIQSKSKRRTPAWY
ncbi:hypothetical protein M8C21_011157 [Ambrosia artemisiifolia]|uniref:Inositol polyphosphate-related phosphatase domain-containing protein n=1 Tax=Ambrosia artemisiifolia TaxID=4212 RepID=A0AAD5BNV1_AMBAR|nr:hypothetical protein M8C21_011157 [Ambrosia artemisiifolia]